MQLVFLKQQVGNNREIELEKSDYNDKIARKQIQLSQLDDTLQLESNEMITFKQILRGQSEKLQQLRRKNRQSIVETEAKGEAINRLIVTCQELSEKMEKMVNHTESAQNRLKQLDELVEAEEKSLSCVEVELTRLSQMLYRSKQILQQWQNEHKLVEVSANHILGISNEANRPVNANINDISDGNSCIGDIHQINYRPVFDAREGVEQTNGNAARCGKENEKGDAGRKGAELI